MAPDERIFLAPPPLLTQDGTRVSFISRGVARMSRWGFVAGKVLLVVALLPAVRGQAPNLSETRLRKDLEYLTSDACEGRGITTRGIQLAAEHIVAEFRKAGLKPGAPDGTYFQTFKVISGF